MKMVNFPFTEHRVGTQIFVEKSINVSFPFNKGVLPDSNV